jgi:co-chaperonin GroES (HSP10)
MVKKMFNEYLLIRRDEGVKQIGTIELLDTTVERPFSGTVVSSFDESEVAINIRIAYQRNAGTPIFVEGEEYWVVRKVDIICEL